MEGKPSSSSSSSGGARLPSFKKKRDLTLGETKKKFVPNLNVQRVKGGGANDATPAPATGGGSPRGGRGGARGRRPDAGGDSNKQGVRSRPELIQTRGAVFEEGVAAGDLGKRRGGAGGGWGGGGGGSSSLSIRDDLKPRVKVEKGDPEEEERRRKALLKDGFVSDLEEGLFVPIQLPMIDTGKVFKAEEEDKEAVDKDKDAEKSKKKKRVNVIDSDDDDDEVEEKESEVAPKVQDKGVGGEDLRLADLVKAQRSELLFLQLPDHLPGVVPKVKKEGGEGAAEEAKPIKKEPSDQPEVEPSKEEPGLCTLRDLPEGFLGKIRIRKSGRAQLVLGQGDGAAFDIELGTQVGFLQEAASVRTSDIPGETGEITLLGHVRHRLVVAPDWEAMLECRADE